MLATLIGPPVPADWSPAAYRPLTAIYSRAEVQARPWPSHEVGTGGAATQQFWAQELGYRPHVVVVPAASILTPIAAPHVTQMHQVRHAFGRTMSRLPEVFGVSRQTLYNWLNGETPKTIHQERLHQLAAAAAVFEHMGVKPTTTMLDRSLAGGQSFLQLMAAGADGDTTARQLLRIHGQQASARAKLDALLGTRKGQPSASDLGTPAFQENT